MRLNEQYGYWKIIEKSKRKGYVVAECVCGTRKEVLINNLRSGRSGSCGCKKRPLAAFNTENIKILYPTTDNKYMCYCERCKRKVELSEYKIRRKPNSCGCGLKKETVSENEILNGYKVLKLLPAISNKKRVSVKCVFCGKERILRLSDLRQNKKLCICRTT